MLSQKIDLLIDQRDSQRDAAVRWRAVAEDSAALPAPPRDAKWPQARDQASSVLARAAFAHGTAASSSMRRPPRDAGSSILSSPEITKKLLMSLTDNRNTVAPQTKMHS